MYLAHQKGSHTVLVEDKNLPGVYHHLCECYTDDDARRIGRLLKAEGEAVWVQRTEKL